MTERSETLTLLNILRNHATSFSTCCSKKSSSFNDVFEHLFSYKGKTLSEIDDDIDEDTWELYSAIFEEYNKEKFEKECKECDGHTFFKLHKNPYIFVLYHDYNLW